jgi:hypothetical protein
MTLHTPGITEYGEVACQTGNAEASDQTKGYDRCLTVKSGLNAPLQVLRGHTTCRGGLRVSRWRSWISVTHV